MNIEIEKIVNQVVEEVLNKLNYYLPTFTIVGFENDQLNKYLKKNNFYYKNLSFEEFDDYKEKNLIFNIDRISQLIRLSNLIAINENEDKIVQSIIEGENIYFNIVFNQSTKPTISKKIVKAKLELEKMGVISIENNTYEKHICIEEKKKKEVITLDKLINDYDIENLSEFKSKKNIIITDLAKDYLKENSIDLI